MHAAMKGNVTAQIGLVFSVISERLRHAHALQLALRNN